MRVRSKILFLSIFAVLLLSLGIGANQAYAGNTGWKSVNGSWYFYQNNAPATGWVYTGNKWYYMDTNGVMKTGWVNDRGSWYFMDSSGAMKTGWVLDRGTWYYLQSSGVMKTGWLLEKGTWYFLDQSGAMKTGWINDQNKMYYLQSSGAMKTGWLKLGADWYYLKSSGEKSIGKVSVGTELYYFDSSGIMQSILWLEDSGMKYYFKPDGAAASGITNVFGTMYLFNTNKVLVSGWEQISGKWYFSNENGIIQTGWVTDQDKTYYLNQSGIMLTGWIWVDNHWYYLDQSGARVSGWLQDKSHWYYLDENGVMLTGWITVDGVEYFLDTNGVWLPISKELEGKIIVLDPGHGGYDSGALAQGVLEKDINLQVGLKLADFLKKSGANVYMTRSTDVFVSLDERVAFSNAKNPDAFISIHVNSAGSSSAIGIETYRNSTGGVLPEESYKLATDIQSELIKSTGAVSRGVKDADFKVLRGNTAPSVLVEMGFISNYNERVNLTSYSYQNKVMNGMYNGLVKFFARF
jgi:glucan-binding YG repeat protein